jgi:hypothetical protein
MLKAQAAATTLRDINSDVDCFAYNVNVTVCPCAHIGAHETMNSVIWMLYCQYCVVVLSCT